MVSIKDVAKLAGVGVSTASRAFRKDVYINEETRKRVLEAAEAIGYIPNASARRLRTHSSKIIGLMTLGMEWQFMSHFHYYIERYLNKFGYNLMIYHSDMDYVEERKALEGFLESRVDGVLFFPCSFRNGDLIERFRQNKVPMIQMFSHQYENVNTIYIDDKTNNYNVTRRLTQAGHRHIYLPEGKDNLSPDRNYINGQYEGHRQALLEVGCDIKPEEFFVMGIGDNIEKMLFDYFSQHKPTAFIGTGSPITMSAYYVMRQLGLRYPEDMSIISYEDDKFCEYMGITAVNHDIYAIAADVSQTLLELIDNPDNSEIINRGYVFDIIERGSVASPISS